MEAHLAPKPLVQVNKIAYSCEICSGPHDTQYCMENLDQAFVDYASSCTDEAGDARLSKFEANFKQQQSEMTNKTDTLLKAINGRMMGALPSCWELKVFILSTAKPRVSTAQDTTASTNQLVLLEQVSNVSTNLRLLDED
ncbi:hypothetical protein Tco_0110861 [Tanacetum coccineum]